MASILFHSKESVTALDFQRVCDSSSAQGVWDSSGFPGSLGQLWIPRESVIAQEVSGTALDSQGVWDSSESLGQLWIPRESVTALDSQGV